MRVISFEHATGLGVRKKRSFFKCLPTPPVPPSSMLGDGGRDVARSVFCSNVLFTARANPSNDLGACESERSELVTEDAW
jgi:hypothetical protein